MSPKGTNQKGIEDSLFKWEGWDPVDTMAINFTDCRMKTSFGPLSKGEKLNSITLDFGKSELTAWIGENAEPDYVVPLKLVPQNTSR